MKKSINQNGVQQYEKIITNLKQEKKVILKNFKKKINKTEKQKQYFQKLFKQESMRSRQLIILLTNLLKNNKMNWKSDLLNEEIEKISKLCKQEFNFQFNSKESSHSSKPHQQKFQLIQNKQKQQDLQKEKETQIEFQQRKKNFSYTNVSYLFSKNNNSQPHSQKDRKINQTKQQIRTQYRKQTKVQSKTKKLKDKIKEQQQQQKKKQSNYLIMNAFVSHLTRKSTLQKIKLKHKIINQQKKFEPFKYLDSKQLDFILQNTLLSKKKMTIQQQNQVQDNQCRILLHQV